jgi:hypothetical protein
MKVTTIKCLLLAVAIVPLIASCARDGCAVCTLRFNAHDFLNMPDSAIAGDHSYMHHY